MSALLRALAEVTVAPDRRSASVAGHQLSAADSRELQAALASALYGLHHSGQGPRPPGGGRRRTDAALAAVLRSAVPHRHSRMQAGVRPPATRRLDPSEVLVELAGLRIGVPGALIDGDAKPGSTVVVPLPACRPALSPGYFVADSPAGPPTGQADLVRLYVHVATLEEAPAIWTAVLARLRGCDRPYRVKVLSERSEYPRRDALVVYLPRAAWSQLGPLVRAVGGLPGLAPETSLFAERLAPGLAVAAEPTDLRPGRSGMSFGQHRCTAVAQALLAAADGAAPLEHTLAVAFAEAGIDPARPARNTSSSGFPAGELAIDEERR